MTSADTPEALDVWQRLGDRLNPAAECPRAQPGLVSRRLTTAAGEDYFIVKNPATRTYVRLSPDEHLLLGLMDGTRSVRELVMAYFQQYQRLALRRVLHVVAQLRQHRFLTDPPTDVWAELAQRLARQRWTHRAEASLQHFMGREFAISGVDGFMGALYRGFGWMFFTRIGAAALAMLALTGTTLFLWKAFAAGMNPLHVHGSAALGLAGLVGMVVLMLVIHESGHALAVKAYGREVNRGGFMIYYGMPAFFVDTTDIWLEPRRARLVVSIAGMAAVWAASGIAMLYVLLVPQGPLAPFALQFAFVALVDNSFNLLPLLELDGYYLLMDWLEMPLLRPRAIAFVRGQLAGKLWRRERFNREERIFAIFGTLALIASAYFIGFGVWFWVAHGSGFVIDVLRGGNPWRSALVAVLFVAVVTPVLLGALIKLARLLARAGGLLAWIGHRRESAQARQRLDGRELLARQRFLQSLSAREREGIVDKLVPRRFRAGEFVVREREEGDAFYLVRSGQAEVLRMQVDGWQRSLVRLQRGDSFGEMALLSRTGRRASVRALTELEVFALDAATFEAQIAPQLLDYGLTQFRLDERAELASAAIFRETPSSELDPILDRLREETFEAGAVIVREGEPGDRFYVVRRGRVEVLREEQGALAQLGPGEHFGEMALLDDAPRAASVRALEPVSLWSLDRAAFDELLLGQLRLGEELSGESERRNAAKRRLAGATLSG